MRDDGRIIVLAEAASDETRPAAPMGSGGRKSAQHPVREAIRLSLENLAHDLDEFEQTAHGRIGIMPCGIGQVAAVLAQCYEKPDAYSISCLAQDIRIFLKRT